MGQGTGGGPQSPGCVWRAAGPGAPDFLAFGPEPLSGLELPGKQGLGLWCLKAFQVLVAKFATLSASGSRFQPAEPSADPDFFNKRREFGCDRFWDPGPLRAS